MHFSKHVAELARLVFLKKSAALPLNILKSGSCPFWRSDIYPENSAHHGNKDITNMVNDLLAVKKLVISQILKQKHNKRIEQPGHASKQPASFTGFSAREEPPAKQAYKRHSRNDMLDRQLTDRCEP